MNMLNANVAIKKRNHAELTVPQKQEIIDFRKKNPKITQKDLIAKFNHEFKTYIPKSTMSDILKPEYERKLQQLNSVEDFNLRIREAKYLDLERCIYLWHSEVLRLNLPVADDLMLEKAKEFGDMLGISTFNYSRGWLENLIVTFCYY